MHPATRLRELEQRARRRFGQNFLVHPETSERIVELAGVKPGDRVLEIGPGLGVLTQALIAAGAQVTCIELDRDLAAGVRELFPFVKLVEGDALRVPLDEACPGEGWKVVANLPYNVGTPILMRLLGEPLRFPEMSLMFQREVGDRLLAAADEDAVGALSVQVQARAEVRRLLTLPPGAFHPAPKIWSVVLGFRQIAAPDFGGVAASVFDRVVRAGYAQRRKTLLNSLSTAFPKDVALAALSRSSIDPRRRAETLTLAEWRTLAAALAG